MAKKEENKELKMKKRIFKIALVVVILVIGYSVSSAVYNSLHKDIITSKTSLQKILEITELSTVEYEYNAIATKYSGKEKKKDNVEYYVAYEGKVIAGVNFNDIHITINKKKKIVNVKLPDVEIQKVDIDINSLDYIFMKNQKEEEVVSQEAYELCKKDLEKRINEETTLYDIGKENAVSIIEALLGPWVESIDKEYKISIK